MYGDIIRGFHFLGVQYLPTQSVNNKVKTQLSLVPHPRTLRNAREQVKYMVEDGASLHEIKIYLSRWLYWWTNSSGTWNKHELLQLFIHNCRDKYIAGIAQEMLQQEFTRLRKTSSVGNAEVVAGGLVA